MNTITIFAFVAVAITGLTLIHETRLRQAARNLLCRLIQFLCDNAKAVDYARVVE